MSWLQPPVEHCPTSNVPYLTSQTLDLAFEEQPMLKTLAFIGFAATLALPAAPAFAVSGNSSSYGTEDYGPTVPTQSLTPFQRAYNHANESKERAYAGAEWLRQHGKGPFPFF
jgi:hypothetical protein